MSKDFATIENERPRFFQALMAADTLARFGPFNDERDERMKVERAEHLKLAKGRLRDLERAYAADIRRMQAMYERAVLGLPMDSGDGDG